MHGQDVRQSYSQFGEDALVTALLQSARGFYADVGAHDPWRYSNTALLFERGWQGINIDADPRAIERFRLARPGDINLNVGVACNAGSMEFRLFADGAVNTFLPELAAQQAAFFGQSRGVRVEVFPLLEIFDRYLPHGTVIDYLNIDCEGLDEEVVMSNNWSRYRPKILTVELHGMNLDRPCDLRTYCFLREQGYVMRGFYFVTGVFQSIESL
jgi:FkbM family methyltransferase